MFKSTEWSSSRGRIHRRCFVYLSDCVASSRQVWSGSSVLDRPAALVPPQPGTRSLCPSRHLVGTDPSPVLRPVNSKYRRSLRPSQRLVGTDPSPVLRPVNSKYSIHCNCNIHTEHALTLLVGRQEGKLARKKLGVGLLVVMIWLELCTSYSSSCHCHIHHPSCQKNPKWRHSGTG